jgi:flavin reductase (DIM6/NTAB) family NADH-FMN oxidoreductase RutF
VKPPLIAECLAAFECKLANTTSCGDHTLFIGEVIASHVSDKNQRWLFSLGGGMYGGI